MANYVSFLWIFLLILPGCKSDDKNIQETSKQPNILFLIADDWSFPHAGIYGDPIVRTPTFDNLAENGALFNHAYCASPSCTPSRAAILTGRYPHQNESVGNLWSVFPVKFPNWVSILQEAGYHTGSTRKGWAPGNYQKGGYTHNPAGESYDNFKTFLQNKKSDQPFCFWFGSSDPHRGYEPNTGVTTGMQASDVQVPSIWPDAECVRNDVLDYYFEVERFDRECGQIIQQLKNANLLDNTMIIMTSDNGMPFPRAKANLYDLGTRMPLTIYWKDHIQSGMKISQFVNQIDLAPTILQSVGLKIPETISGKTLWPVLKNNSKPGDRDHVFLERERHANVRKGDLSYPMRAIRTLDYLYIRNFFPDRYPAGDPLVHQSVGQYGDIDNSITKFLIMKEEDSNPDLFNLSFGKRPAEELYDLQIDPDQVQNRAEDEALQATKQQLVNLLSKWMESSGDIRYDKPQSIYWDTVWYTPEYQFADYDLQAKIESYELRKRMGNGRFVNLSCVEDSKEN